MSPKDAFAEPGYYTGVTDTGDPVALNEVLYEHIEDGAAKAYRSLLKQGAHPADLSAEERSKFAMFLATQMYRGESFRATTQDFTGEIGKTMMQMRAAHIDEWWPAFEQKQRDEGEPLAPGDREKFLNGVKEESFVLKAPQEHLLNLRVVAMNEIAELFFAYAWHTVRFPEPCLFTAEEPVVYWRAPFPGSEFLGIGAATTDEVRIVLSPSDALILTHFRQGFEDRDGKGTSWAAALINWGTLLFRDGSIVKTPGVAGYPLPTAEWGPRSWEPDFQYGPVIAA